MIGSSRSGWREHSRRTRSGSDARYVNGGRWRRKSPRVSRNGVGLRPSASCRNETASRGNTSWRRPASSGHPWSNEPSVIPVAAKNTSLPDTRSSVVSTRSGSSPPSRSCSRSSSVRGASRPWIAPPMHFNAAAAMTPSGVPPIPSSRSTPERGAAAEIAPSTSPSVIRNTRAPTFRTAVDDRLVAGSIEDHHRDLLDLHPFRLRHQPDVLLRRGGHVDHVGRLRPRRDLLHVDGDVGEEHRPSFRERDHRDRVGLARSGETCAVDRVDRDVHRRSRPVPDGLAVVQHRRLVLLALADDDDAVHRDRVDHETHRVHGRLIGGDLVASTDPASGGERRGFGHASELHREVAVGTDPVRHRSTSRTSRGRAPSNSTRWTAS